MSNTTYRIYGIILFSISFLMMRGTIQNYIPFNSMENEMGFAFLSAFLGTACLICGFTKESEQSK